MTFQCPRPPTTRPRPRGLRRGRATITRQSASAFGHSTTPFVGRIRELAILVEALDSVVAGAGRMVLIAGEPGVGKTRLADLLAERARRRGLRAVRGRGLDDEGSPPYWPLREILKSWHDGAEQLLVAPSSSSAERYALFESVTDYLSRAATPTGLVIVLDDVQWLDPGSQAYLTYLARDIARMPILVVATYRDTEVVGNEPLRRTLSTLADEPGVTGLRLGGLTESEVDTLLTELLGAGGAAADVCRRTRGNPFFVTELARVLSDDVNAALPERIRDAVRSRLDRLTPPCRDIVTAAATVGSGAGTGALAALSGHPMPTVLAALDEAAAAAILSSTGEFEHDLVRETARVETPTARRLELHRRMAEYLAHRVDAADRVAEIAFHLLAALPVGDPAAAATWAERAAERALTQLAWEEAARLYGRAAEVSADAGFGELDRSRMLIGKAKAQARGNDIDGARESVLAAAELARAVHDGAGIAEAALALEGITDNWIQPRKPLYEEAFELLPDGDSPLRARLLAHWAIQLAYRAPEEAEARSALALAMAERTGDRTALREALRARQITRGGPDGVTERLTLGDRMIALGREDDDDYVVFWGHLWRFDALVQSGRIDHADAELIAVGRCAERLRSPLARWHLTRSSAALALGRGRFEQARELGERALALARSASHIGAVSPSLGFVSLADVPTGRGRDRADEYCAGAAAAFPPLRAFGAAMVLGIGRRAEAERLYRTLLPFDSLPVFVRLAVLADTAELAREFDDREMAAEIYRRLEPHAELFACNGAGITAVRGSVHLPLGRAAATQGRFDTAIRHLRAAIEVNRSAGLPPAALEAEFELARVLARRGRAGDREQAQALAAATAAAAAALGMVPLHERCQELAESLADHAPGPLTPREREIAELVSRGLTNRQIAAALHIAERTAENHVQHILVKLGFTGRAQIAAWFVVDRRE
ncbi:AAA family ATPase [Nocardia sp. CDC153]|uniref:ATP-binding protein n=1 Tax=Nocardia sp. CDC153 TaxID=3112167 RepID=UPI002DB78974|nr:AAA family ATPase [Nocardia sp. CDC153]MEC3956970.1 AAA family ATPase [Nocardia sp. CDC153]